jgi:hypothetical protein
MTPNYPRVRFPARRYTSQSMRQGVVEHLWERLIVRDVVRIVFFVPYDHFDIAAGVSHALDSYIARCGWRPECLVRIHVLLLGTVKLSDRGWELIRGT